MFHTPSLPKPAAAPTQADYASVTQAYMNQLNAVSKAAGLGSTNPTGGMGALMPPQVSGKTMVGE
jgi:hypothetical protein